MGHHTSPTWFARVNKNFTSILIIIHVLIHVCLVICVHHLLFSLLRKMQGIRNRHHEDTPLHILHLHAHEINKGALILTARLPRLSSIASDRNIVSIY